MVTFSLKEGILFKSIFFQWLSDVLILHFRNLVIVICISISLLLLRFFSCLNNPPSQVNAKFKEIQKKLAGETYSRDDQCKLYLGNQASHCGWVSCCRLDKLNKQFSSPQQTQEGTLGYPTSL